MCKCACWAQPSPSVLYACSRHQTHTVMLHNCRITLMYGLCNGASQSIWRCCQHGGMAFLLHGRDMHTSPGEEKANLGAFGAFVRFALVCFCLFPPPLRVWDGLRLVIVALPGFFSYLWYSYFEEHLCIFCWLFYFIWHDENNLSLHKGVFYQIMKSKHCVACLVNVKQLILYLYFS